jgi:hypothetical protein
MRKSDLVCEQNTGDWELVIEDDLAVKIIFPLQNSIKGGWSCEIKHHHGSNGVLVVHVSHTAKALMPSDIPIVSSY